MQADKYYSNVYKAKQLFALAFCFTTLHNIASDIASPNIASDFRNGSKGLQEMSVGSCSWLDWW